MVAQPSGSKKDDHHVSAIGREFTSASATDGVTLPTPGSCTRSLIDNIALVLISYRASQRLIICAARRTC